uniref:Uncharacterized protein n=1 Tax=Brassica campestris TaxID=3711 RepID=M4ESU2_BRACM
MFLDFLSDNKTGVKSKWKGLIHKRRREISDFSLTLLLCLRRKQTQEQRSKSKPSDGFLRQGGGLEKANLCGQNHEGKKEGFSDKTGRKAKKYEVGHQWILKALPSISKTHLEEEEEEEEEKESRENTTT